MIYGKLEDLQYYKGLKEVYSQLTELSKVKAEDIGPEPKKVAVDGDVNYFTLFEAETKHLVPPRLEVHHRAADIHCVFEGVEAIWYGDYEGTEPDGEYIVERDVAFLKGVKENVCYVGPGEFLIVFPEEIHSPLNASHGCEKIKKAVGKIFYK
ncbi:MAG: DUF386 domain-containing protein [Hungatella sp.]|nr:DUF386 domain-containing protein [Hungatella sp.]